MEGIQIITTDEHIDTHDNKHVYVCPQENPLEGRPVRPEPLNQGHKKSCGDDGSVGYNGLEDAEMGETINPRFRGQQCLGSASDAKKISKLIDVVIFSKQQD